LKGGAANDKGEVTLSQLVKYVQDAVPKRIAIDLGSTKQQKPFAVIEGYRADELVLAVTNSATNAATNNTPNMNVIDPAAIELSYWDTIKNSNNPEDFKSYLEKYPDGQFASLAKSRANGLRPAGNGPSGESSEMLYWNAIKDSRNPADLRAYVTKFPGGLFVELANNRIASLEAEGREAAKARENAAAAERSRNTHLYDVTDASRTSGTLTIAPGTISFEPRKQKENKNVIVQCSEIKRVEQGQSAFALGHINLYLTPLEGSKERQLLFYTVKPASGGFFTPVKPGSDITTDVLNAIIEACGMKRINK